MTLVLRNDERANCKSTEILLLEREICARWQGIPYVTHKCKCPGTKICKRNIHSKYIGRIALPMTSPKKRWRIRILFRPDCS